MFARKCTVQILLWLFIVDVSVITGALATAHSYRNVTINTLLIGTIRMKTPRWQGVLYPREKESNKSNFCMFSVIYTRHVWHDHFVHGTVNFELRLIFTRMHRILPPITCVDCFAELIEQYACFCTCEFSELLLNASISSNFSVILRRGICCKCVRNIDCKNSPERLHKE